MTERVQRYTLSFIEEDTLDPGLFQKSDGTVWLRNPDGSTVQIMGGGGGGGLPTGWTQDDSDPANVQTNAGGDTSVGNLLFGSLDSANLAVWNEGLSGALDDGVSGWLQLGHDGMFLRSAADTTAIVIDNSDAPAVAMDAGGLPIQSVAEGVNPSDVATVSQLPSGGGGALVLLDTIINSTTAAFDVTGIDQSYEDLILVLRISGAGVSGGDECELVYNGDGNTTHYNIVSMWQSGVTPEQDAGNFAQIARFPESAFGSVEIVIPGYSSTTWRKQALSSWGYADGSTRRVGQNWHEWADTSAITEVNVYGINGNFVAGSRLDIYGRGTA